MRVFWMITGAHKLSQKELRDRVHHLLKSEEWRGRWVCVLDDLPAPSEEAMEGGGLEWLTDEFPWQAGRTIITSRSREWVQIADSLGGGKGELAAANLSAEVGSFSEAEAILWVTARASRWAADGDGVRELVRYLHCFPLAVAQAAEYARFHHAATPAGYLEALKQAGLKLRKAKRGQFGGEYPHTFPEVVDLTVRAIKQTADGHAGDAQRALQKLALVDATAIPLEVLADTEREGLHLLEEHSLVSPDGTGNVKMHALTQLVVRELLTETAERPALAAAVAQRLREQLDRFHSDKPGTYASGRLYAAHAYALAAHAAEWGLLPEVEAHGGVGPGAFGGEAPEGEGFLGDVRGMCMRAGNFFCAVGGQFRQALGMYEIAWGCGVALHGHVHPHVADANSSIGLVYRHLGRYEEALVQYGKAQEVYVAVYGDMHPHVADTKFNIGVVHWKMQDWGNVVSCFESAYQVRLATFGQEHPQTKDTLKWLNSAKIQLP